MEENLKKEIVQHITKNLLDIQILRIINKQPTWGYQIRIPNKKANRSHVRTKNTPRSPIPTTTKTRKQRTNHKPKTTTRKTHKKNVHTNRERKKYMTAYYNVIKEQNG